MPRVLSPFEYLEPKTAEEAIRFLSDYNKRAKVLAGGVDLVDRMRRRDIGPEYVVSLRSIPGLDRVEGNETKGLRIGALVTLRSVERCATIRRHYVSLWEAVHQIAPMQVKTMGTMVGNLCVATPASDVAVALLALGAELRILDPAGERIVPIENFFVGVHQTILQPSEIVVEVLLPSLPPATAGAFMNLVRAAADISKVSTAVTLTAGSNICRDIRIAVGAVAPTVVRAKQAEETLKEQKLEQKLIEAAAEAAAREVRPITDIRSTAEYRKEMTKVLVRRTIEKAWERLNA